MPRHGQRESALQPQGATEVAEWCVRCSQGKLWGVATTYEGARALAARLQDRWKRRLSVYQVLRV